jgi:exodeoxyribonuclease VII small subunit
MQASYVFQPMMPSPSESTADRSDPAPPASFEAALAELESLVAELEGGQLPLAEALTAYRRGATLLQYAQGQLQSAQEQVKILEGDLLKNYEQEGRNE